MVAERHVDPVVDRPGLHQLLKILVVSDQVGDQLARRPRLRFRTPVEPVGGDGGKNAGEPIWDVVATYLRDIKTVKPVNLNLPTLKGAANNPGIA